MFFNLRLLLSKAQQPKGMFTSRTEENIWNNGNANCSPQCDCPQKVDAEQRKPDAHVHHSEKERNASDPKVEQLPIVTRLRRWVTVCFPRSEICVQRLHEKHLRKWHMKSWSYPMNKGSPRNYRAICSKDQKDAVPSEHRSLSNLAAHSGQSYRAIVFFVMET